MLEALHSRAPAVDTNSASSFQSRSQGFGDIGLLIKNLSLKVVRGKIKTVRTSATRIPSHSVFPEADQNFQHKYPAADPAMVQDRDPLKVSNELTFGLRLLSGQNCWAKMTCGKSAQ